MKPSQKRRDDEADGARSIARTRTETNVIDEAQGRRDEDEKDAVPQRLGRYTILSRVGRGAVGEVFEAEPPEPGAEAVAIKAIRGMSPDALYRFKREFRALADVRHRNVIRLHELMLQGDRLFFSMELIRGRGFAEAICGPPRDGTRTLHDPARDYDRVRDVMRQLAEGVQAIHDAGFLHRDLKPSNVLIEDSGRVVILDFGLVRDINPDDGVGVTADGAVLGTPLFMSPEQACGWDVGAPSDWYTVGEMLYQLLTGAPPYAGMGLIALLAAKKEELPKLPSERVAGIPPDLQSLCMDLLSRDPDKRPTGHEVLERLGSTERVDFPEDKNALFLGRDNELRGLQRAFAGLRKGGPVVVMLEGVSGIGKSALVEQFLRRVSRNDGALVLAGKCSERESIDTDSVEIYHDRIRETVLRDLDTRAARDLHLRLAHALLETAEPDPSDLSHHFRRAGEPELASKYTIAAADQASEALAFDRAAELYRTALDLDTIENEQRADIEERCARALASAGRLYEAAKVFLSASDLLPVERRPPLLQAAAELLLTSGHSREGRVVLKQVLGAQGVDLPESRGRAIRSLLWNRAALAFKNFKVDGADPSATEAKVEAKLDALWTAARGLIYTDGLLGADFQAQHLRLSLKSRDPIHLARALGFEAHLASSMKPVSKRDHCFGLLDHAESLADDASSPYAKGMVYQARGHVQLFLGEWRDALTSLDDGNRIFVEQTIGAAQEIGFCEAHAALCLQFMGRVQELAPRAHDLLRASTQHAHPYSQGFARGLLGHLVYLAADRAEDAEEQLTLYREGAPWGFQAHIQNYVSQTTALLRYKGDVEAAWRLVEARAPEIEGFDLMRSPFPQAEHRFWISQNALAMAVRRPGERDEFLKIAGLHGRKLVSAQPIRYQRAYGHLTLGNVHQQRGEHEVAAGHFRQAIDAFEAHEMGSFSAVARTRLAHLIGGSEAEELRARAREYIERERIAAPKRLFEMISPGSAEAIP